MTLRALVVCLALMPMDSMAQQLGFDIAATADCVAAQQAEACIGRAAEQCMEDNAEGYSTALVAMCMDRELTWWDDRLNRVYGEVRRQLAEQEDDRPEFAPDQVAALTEMQRAWIPFRDAKCLFERSEWGGGTGGGPAHVSCLLHETARQVLYLESRMDAR